MSDGELRRDDEEIDGLLATGERVERWMGWCVPGKSAAEKGKGLEDGGGGGG